MKTPQWFCKIAGCELGPLAEQQLIAMVREKRLNPTDLVRRDDSRWVPAGKVKGLFPLAADSSPATAHPPTIAPATPATPAPASVSKHEVTADWSPEPTAAMSATAVSDGPQAIPGSTGAAGAMVPPDASPQAANTPPMAGPPEAGTGTRSTMGRESGSHAVNLAPGATLGNYRILATLGEGGMGVVLKAQHIRMERIVALKVLRGPATDSPAAIKRFQQEVKAAARLVHPNIVTAYDADEVQGVHFLVMEFVDGQNLADYLAARGRLELTQTIDFITQTAVGLAYAHSKGVVHRDIKPGNLLVDKEGVLKILDMGLASIRESRDGGDAATGDVHADVTQANQLLGTFDYMPPEQAEDPRKVDPRADIYSLGCTLYRLLTGQLPYRGDSPIKKIIAHRDHPIPSLQEARADIPGEVDRIAQKMMAKRAEDRYQTMAELLADLDGCLTRRLTDPRGGGWNVAGQRGSAARGTAGGMGTGASKASSKFGGGDGLLTQSGAFAPPGSGSSMQDGSLPGGADAPLVIKPSDGSDEDDDFGFNLAPAEGVGEHRYFWQCMGQEVGPFTLRQLRAKKLGPEELVRRDDSRQWKRAIEVVGLF
jgi:serine/threonine protein kinase